MRYPYALVGIPSCLKSNIFDTLDDGKSYTPENGRVYGLNFHRSRVF